MKLSIIALWVVAAGLTATLASPLALAQAPADGAVLEKNIPIKVTEVAPGLFFQSAAAPSSCFISAPARTRATPLSTFRRSA